METEEDLKELEKIITHHKPDLTSLLANEVRIGFCKKHALTSLFY